MSKQLFKGQTNHVMSEEELQEFCKISRIVHDSGKDQQKQEEIFNMLLREACTTPTGREFIRRAIQKGDILHFNLKKTSAEFFNKNAAGEYSHVSDIAFVAHKDDWDKNALSRFLASSTLLHESMHDLQDLSWFRGNKLLVDAEPQALSNQIYCERFLAEPSLFDNAPDFKAQIRAVGKHYMVNYNKWLAYAKNPKKIPNDAPKNFLKFEPVANLSSKELAHAQSQYAAQMASLETRAAVIDCWMNASYGSRALKKRGHYFDLIFNSSVSYADNDNSLDDDMINDILERNPFVKRSMFSGKNAQMRGMNYLREVGYGKVFQEIIPALKKAGFSDEKIADLGQRIESQEKKSEKKGLLRIFSSNAQPVDLTQKTLNLTKEEMRTFSTILKNTLMEK